MHEDGHDRAVQRIRMRSPPPVTEPTSLCPVFVRDIIPEKQLFKHRDNHLLFNSSYDYKKDVETFIKLIQTRDMHAGVLRDD